jgi:hypothetical protein
MLTTSMLQIQIDFFFVLIATSDSSCSRWIFFRCLFRHRSATPASFVLSMWCSSPPRAHPPPSPMSGSCPGHIACLPIGCLQPVPAVQIEEVGLVLHLSALRRFHISVPAAGFRARPSSRSRPPSRSLLAVGCSASHVVVSDSWCWLWLVLTCC